MFQFWNILDSQPINENTITLGETVSDPAIYTLVHNTNSKKVCLESSQKREAERTSKKMLPKALYLSIYLSAALSKTSSRNFACKSTKEFVMALHGYLDLRLGYEYSCSKSHSNLQNCWYLYYDFMTSTAPFHRSQEHSKHEERQEHCTNICAQ